jgi:hypothetical protein
MGQIICIEAYNAFGIKAQVVHPKQFNVIQGGNATGKTSWLDIINVLLFNNNPRHDVIMIGENEAIIKGKTDDGLEVERHLFNDGRADKLQVKINGEVQQGPQTLLNHLFGLSDKKKETISVNPVELMFKLKGKGRTDKERSEIILSTVPMFTLDENWSLQTFGKVLPINYALHDLIICKEAEKYYYDVRRDANNIVEATENQATALQKQIPENYKVEEWENASTMEISDSIRKGEQTNNFRKQGQEIVDGIESAKKAINDNYDLQVKEKQDFKDFKVGKVKEDIEKEKQIIRDDIENIKTSIQNHNTEIERLQALIREEEAAIKDKENKILLKQKDLDNFDNSILTTKTESLINEMNAAVTAINENRKRELDAADERVKKAEVYLAENPEVDIKPLEEKYSETEKMKGFVEMAHNLQAITDRLTTEKATAKKYDDFVKLCRKKPQELLKMVDVPFEGFEIDDEGIVRINGQHLENFNTQAMMDICVRVAKHYIKDAKEKIICLDKLECFDPVERAEFENKCRADENYQYFTTYVIPEIDAEKLKTENPELYEKYKNSMELSIISK